VRRFNPPRLTALTAALLIPGILAVVLAGIWLASHAKSTPTVATNPTPTAAAPTPAPLPYVWPQESGGTLDPPRAYGRIALAAPSGPAPGHLDASIAADATVPPARIAGTLDFVERVTPPDAATVEAIAARLAPRAGSTTDRGITVWGGGALRYDAGRADFAWQPAAAAGLPLVPRDLTTAVEASVEWLHGKGLSDAFVPTAARQVSNGDRAAFATWIVTVPHLGGQSAAAVTTMLVSASGLIGRLDMVHPIVLAKSQYPLADWHEAWTHVQAGNVYSISATGAGFPIPLHVDSVQVTSQVVQTDRGAAVIPMYAFADSASGTTAYWPALTPADYTLP
jgi:hypothetical protein